MAHTGSSAFLNYVCCISMLTKLLKYITALVILLHCLGVTQVMSSCAKDRSAFISMLNMNEEETKKEKESSDEDTFELYNDSTPKFTLVQSVIYNTGEKFYFSHTLKGISHQFVIESPTPPPDFTA